MSGKEEPRSNNKTNKQRFIIKVHDNTSYNSLSSTLFNKVLFRVTRKNILIVLTYFEYYDKNGCFSDEAAQCSLALILKLSILEILKSRDS